MTAPEFSRLVKARPHPPASLSLAAGPAECAALAARLGLSALTSLSAEVAMNEDGDAIDARGVLRAEAIQPCAVSGEDFATTIEEPLALRFVRTLRRAAPDEEIELADEDADEIEFDGETFDIGEAIAQTLALAIDPYALGPGAEAARRDAGLSDETTPRGPLADALAALKRD